MPAPAAEPAEVMASAVTCERSENVHVNLGTSPGPASNSTACCPPLNDSVKPGTPPGASNEPTAPPPLGRVDASTSMEPLPPVEPQLRCDNELRSRPVIMDKIELGKTRLQWEDIICQFDRFIYEKTYGVPRDRSFANSLSGLRQRFLKKENIEDVPKWVTDRLAAAANSRMKPTQTEMDLAQTLADPETRFGLRVVNNALRGEVFTVNRQAVIDWGYAWASELKVANWIPIWNTSKSVKLPMISLWFMFAMWAWFLLMDPTCWFFVGRYWTPPDYLIWLPGWGAYYSDHPGPHLFPYIFNLRGYVTFFMRLAWWYSVIMWVRRFAGCLLYLCRDYTRDGYYKTFHRGWSLFNPGNE